VFLPLLKAVHVVLGVEKEIRAMTKYVFLMLLVVAAAVAQDRHIINPSVQQKESWINSHRTRIVVVVDKLGLEYTLGCDSRDTNCVPVAPGWYPMNESPVEVCTDKPNVEVGGHYYCWLQS
jgi:hypothetical protein